MYFLYHLKQGFVYGTKLIILWRRANSAIKVLAFSLQLTRSFGRSPPIFTDTANGYIGPNSIPVPDYFFKMLL